ncbi:MAG: hypothetical protein ACWGKN_01485 [Desulfoprunum sp.]
MGSEGRGGLNRIDHHLSFDTAKEPSLVERNHKGRQSPVSISWNASG